MKHYILISSLCAVIVTVFLFGVIIAKDAQKGSMPHTVTHTVSGIAVTDEGDEGSETTAEKYETVVSDNAGNISIVSYGYSIEETASKNNPYVSGGSSERGNAEISKKTSDAKKQYEENHQDSFYDGYFPLKKLAGTYRSDSGEPCEKHEYADHGKELSCMYTYLHETPHHILTYREIFICEKCGDVKYGEVLSYAEKHAFDFWRLISDEHIGAGGTHSFTYEGFCSECHQYCLKTVSVSCPGGGDCVTADEYIYD